MFSVGKKNCKEPLPRFLGSIIFGENKYAHFTLFCASNK